MAYSDFDSFFSDTYFTFGNGEWENGAAGLAISNSALSSPLTNAGPYCRGFRATGRTGTSVQSSIKYFYKSSFENGALVNPADNVAVSSRAWVRMSTPSWEVASEGGSNRRRAWIGLTSFAEGNTNYFGGWELALQTTRTSSDPYVTNLVLRGGPSIGGSNQSAATVNNIDYNQLTVAEEGLAFDTWYLIRLDIVPTSADQKTITAYRSADEGVTWNTLATHETVRGDRDWPGDSYDKRCGFSLGTTNGSLFTADIDLTAYIDRFQIGVETVS